MNTAMFHATMIEVLKYDSKFKDKKDALLNVRLCGGIAFAECIEFLCGFLNKDRSVFAIS